MVKNKYIGNWTEAVSNAITLEFTPSNAHVVISAGLDSSSEYTHQDIAHWCDKYWRKYCDVDAEDEVERIMPVLADVDAQWDLFLANTYDLEQLQQIDFSQVRMPIEWFEGWLRELEAEQTGRPSGLP